MERALVVNVHLTHSSFRDSWPAEESAREMVELVESSGVEVLESLVVNKDRPTPASFVGSGKVQELHQRSHAIGANVVIFSEDLNAVQLRNLDELLGLKVIDRTQLILDIFAQRARSQDGQVQVELAQLQYLLPRLAGKGTELSRLGGGIGTRGPGEQKLEMDRRRIRLRIGRLKKELEVIRLRRGVARRKRQEDAVPTVTLIGYTNVGKSTLLNALTQTGTPAENRLFTTLDPLTRRLVLPNHQPIVLADTVGFIHRLPHHLVEAFQATLEEVIEGHLLLHVMDASHPMLQEQATAVSEVLKVLEAEGKPVLSVFNKIDRLDSNTLQLFQRRHPEAVFISAQKGTGLASLLDRLGASLDYLTRTAVIRIGHHAQHWLERIYKEGNVLHRRDLRRVIELEARVPARLYGQLQKAGLLKPA